MTLAENINPYIARVYSVRGNLYLQEMQYKKAEVALKRALEINPNDEITQLHIGVFYLFKNIPEVDKYLYHVNKALEIDPVSTHLKRSRVWALIENGRVDEAEKAMEEYKSVFSEGNILHHNSQIIAYKNKDWNAAYTFLKDAHNEDPENKEIVFNEDMDNLMIKKLTKKASGVIVITVLTSPYPEYTGKDGQKKRQKEKKLSSQLVETESFLLP